MRLLDTWMAFLTVLGVTFTPSDPLRTECKASLGAWTLRSGKLKGIPFNCSYFASSSIEEAETCKSGGGESLLTERSVKQRQAGMCSALKRQDNTWSLTEKAEVVIFCPASFFFKVSESNCSSRSCPWTEGLWKHQTAASFLTERYSVPGIKLALTCNVCVFASVCICPHIYYT